MLLVYSFVHYSIAHINLFLFIYFGKLSFDCFFVMLDLVGFFFVLIFIVFLQKILHSDINEVLT